MFRMCMTFSLFFAAAAAIPSSFSFDFDCMGYFWFVVVCAMCIWTREFCVRAITVRSLRSALYLSFPLSPSLAHSLANWFQSMNIALLYELHITHLFEYMDWPILFARSVLLFFHISWATCVVHCMCLWEFVSVCVIACICRCVCQICLCVCVRIF